MYRQLPIPFNEWSQVIVQVQNICIKSTKSSSVIYELQTMYITSVAKEKCWKKSAMIVDKLKVATKEIVSSTVVSLRLLDTIMSVQWAEWSESLKD